MSVATATCNQCRRAWQYCQCAQGPHAQPKTRTRQLTLREMCSQPGQGAHSIPTQEATQTQPEAETHDRHEPQGRPWLSQGGNWTCQGCEKRFTGTSLKVCPPAKAPSIWCKTCKESKNLASARCGTCLQQWRRCECKATRLCANGNEGIQGIPCSGKPPPPREHPPETIRRYVRSDVYWERQDAHSAHCAVHAINGILQRTATNNTGMHQAAAMLDNAELSLLHPSLGHNTDGNAEPDGNFTIQVIQWVLERQPEGWSLVDSRNPSVCARIATEPQKEIGYIVNPGGHWRALRSIPSNTGRRHWYDLDSLLPAGPRYTTDAQLRAILTEIVVRGGTVFVVINRLHRMPDSIRAIDAASRTAPDRRHRRLRLGTDFAGMDMAAYALRMAGVPFQHAFATESDPVARAHIAQNHDVDHLYACTKERPTASYSATGRGAQGEGELDLYIAGLPCQLWTRDKHAATGEHAPRGSLMEASVAFIAEARPRAFVLENVTSLIRHEGGVPFHRTLARIRAAGYKTSWAKLNPLEMGLPQNRPKLYIWGLRADTGSDLPEIHTGAAEENLSLGDILNYGKLVDTSQWTRIDDALPEAAAECVKRTAARADTRSLAGQDWIVDEQVARARGQDRKASTHFPCLQRSRRSPPWIGSRCRKATVAEACRAQGLPPTMVSPEAWERPQDMCRLLGSSMASNALLRVAVPLIRAIRPELEIQDPWSTGHAQRMIRISAQATSETPGGNGYGSASKQEPAGHSAPTVGVNAAPHGEPTPHNIKSTDEAQLDHAHSGGNLYQEIFQVLGPGIPARKLAAVPWRHTLPPKHCSHLCRIAVAIRAGEPLPDSPTEGWSRQDLEQAQQGLWHCWGIAVLVKATGHPDPVVGMDHTTMTDAGATFHFQWSYMTGALRLTGASVHSPRAGQRIARGHPWAMTQSEHMRIAPLHKTRLRADDQSIYKGTCSHPRQLARALRHFRCPRITLGWSSHPIQGAAISAATTCTPNLLYVLHRFINNQHADYVYTSIDVQWAAHPAHEWNESGPSELAQRNYIVTEDSSVCTPGDGYWNVRYYTHHLAGVYTPHGRKWVALQKFGFPGPNTTDQPDGDLTGARAGSPRDSTVAGQATLATSLMPRNQHHGTAYREAQQGASNTEPKEITVIALRANAHIVQELIAKDACKEPDEAKAGSKEAGPALHATGPTTAALPDTTPPHGYSAWERGSQEKRHRQGHSDSIAGKRSKNKAEVQNHEHRCGNQAGEAYKMKQPPASQSLPATHQKDARAGHNSQVPDAGGAHERQQRPPPTATGTRSHGLEQNTRTSADAAKCDTPEAEKEHIYKTGKGPTHGGCDNSEYATHDGTDPSNRCENRTSGKTGNTEEWSQGQLGNPQPAAEGAGHTPQPLDAKEGEDARKPGESNNRVNAERSCTKPGATHYWTCAECAHSFRMEAKPSVHGRAPTRWCPGCGRTRRVANDICDACSCTWRLCQCLTDGNHRDDTIGGCTSGNSTEGHASHALSCQQVDHCEWPYSDGTRRATHGNDHPIHVLRFGHKGGKHTHHSRAAHMGELTARQMTEARSGSNERGTQLDSLPPQKRRKGNSHSILHEVQDANERGVSRRGAVPAGDTTLTKGMQGIPQGRKRRQRSTDTRCTRHRTDQSPAQMEGTNTRIEGNKKCVLATGKCPQSADAAWAAAKPAKKSTPKGAVSAASDGGIATPTGCYESRGLDRKTTSRRAHSGHKSSRTASSPTIRAECGAPHQRKRIGWRSRSNFVDPQCTAKRIKFTAECTARERGRQQQHLHAPADEGIVRDASPQEPLPRLQGRGWHDRWPPPASGGCGTAATPFG